MTSKEALNWMGHELRDNTYFSDPIEQHKVDLMWEKIEKDLELLELLKGNSLLKYLIEKELFDTSNLYCGTTNENREKIKDYRNKLNKIKEWLKND